MKKICFVTMGNIYVVPYLPMYTKFIENSYSVIYWDRENKHETSESNIYYRFAKNIKHANALKKIVGFFQYRNFIKEILKKQEFDLVIFLQTWSSLLVADVVKKYYSGKYIIDVRDYTYEHNPIISLIEKNVFKKAAMVVVSSEGYKEFLPRRDYYIAHNARKLDDNIVQMIRQRPKERKQINIAFIGYVNYQEQHKKLIKKLGNDDRFKLSFIGTKALELDGYCKENNINNVVLIDTFDSQRILEFYKDVDMINNLYGNHTPTLDYALSNKLYFAAELCIPILVCPDTYMKVVSCDFGFGCEVDLDSDDVAETIWQYYQTLDWNILESSCDKFMENVRLEQEMLETNLEKVLK